MEVRIEERAHQHFTVHVIPLFPAFEFSYFLKYLQPNEGGFNSILLFLLLSKEEKKDGRKKERNKDKKME